MAHLHVIVIDRIHAGGTEALLRYQRPRQPGYRDMFSRIGNFCRPLVGWSFGALAQPAKQSSRRFTDGLQSCVAPAFHEQQQTTGEIGNVRISLGAQNECR